MWSKQRFARLRAAIRRRFVSEKTTEEYSKISYMLPVPKESLVRFGSEGISPAHVGNLKNSIDFHVPEGTEIYAAAGGRVVETKDDSDVGGPDTKFWNDGDYVVIDHGGELTEYEHLKFRGVEVEVGDVVAAGEVIGRSGSTGLSSEPHLHFEVRKYFGKKPGDYVTLKARFNNFVDVYRKLIGMRVHPQKKSLDAKNARTHS